MTKRSEWFSSFFAGLYSQVLPSSFSPAQTLSHVRLVRRLLALRKNERVLDIPCGQGRLTIPLARAGLTMTGVDLIPTYIRQARQHARSAGVAARFIQADMRQIEFDAEFDAAFNWFGSFGYFSHRQNELFLGRVWKALKPGGRILLEGLNRSWLVRHLAGPNQEQVGPVLINHQSHFNRTASRLNDVWTLTKGRRVERHRISMRVYTGGEIRQMLRAAGFVDIQLLGLARLRDSRSAQTMPLTAGSRRWIATAKRPNN